MHDCQTWLFRAILSWRLAGCGGGSKWPYIEENDHSILITDMSTRRIFFLAALLVPVLQIRPQQTAKAVDFWADIQPILAKNCQSCHQGGAAPADLRLDSRRTRIASA